MLQLHGHVTTGIGSLSGWMSTYAAVYAAAVGADLVSGSLNIALDTPWVMRLPEIRLTAAEIGVDAGLVAARVDGVACWVMRTDKNNRGEGDHVLDVVELIAAVHLRSALDVGDGDPVVVEVETP